MIAKRPFGSSAVVGSFVASGAGPVAGVAEESENLWLTRPSPCGPCGTIAAGPLRKIETGWNCCLIIIERATEA
jgi:hypothetical protein